MDTLTPITMVCVTCARNVRFLIAMMLSFTKFGPRDGVRWLLLTRRSEVEPLTAAIIQAFGWSLDIKIHPYPADAEEIKDNYAAHQAAKLTAWNHVATNNIVFTDDDVLANRDWSPRLFFREEGAPIIHYQRERGFWNAGMEAVFGRTCDNNYQIALPFAYTREALVNLTGSQAFRKSQRMRHQGNLSAAEFGMMGEFASEHNIGSHRDRAKQKDHWTLDAGVFTDYARRRDVMLDHPDNLGMDTAVC